MRIDFIFFRLHRRLWSLRHRHCRRFFHLRRKSRRRRSRQSFLSRHYTNCRLRCFWSWNCSCRSKCFLKRSCRNCSNCLKNWSSKWNYTSRPSLKNCLSLNNLNRSSLRSCLWAHGRSSWKWTMTSLMSSKLSRPPSEGSAMRLRALTLCPSTLSLMELRPFLRMRRCRPCSLCPLRLPSPR